jgi:DNA-binding protein YbaB
MSPEAQPDLGELIEQARAMQQRAEDMRATMAATWVTGEADGGRVTVTATALGEFNSVSIDRTVVSTEDTGELEELVLAALRDLTGQLRDLTQRRLADLNTDFTGVAEESFSWP